MPASRSFVDDNDVNDVCFDDDVSDVTSDDVTADASLVAFSSFPSPPSLSYEN
jgi:hypothetical protein